MTAPPPFDGELFASLVAARGLALGRPLEVHARTSSSMDEAFAAAARGAPHGTVVVAEEQLAGRGRHGRQWVAGPGEGLTFSVLLRPRLALAEAPLVALASGLAVRAAVARRVRASVLVKWPNDILVSGRKLAGVLVECRQRGSAPPALVVGVGLNLETVAFPAALAASATSLALAGATDRARERCLADLLGELAPRVGALEAGSVAALVAELGAHDALRDRWLSVGAVTGRGAGIDSHGALLVRQADGCTVAVSSGTVALAEADGASA